MRATAPKADNPSQAALSNEELTGAESVYRRIAQRSAGGKVADVSPSDPLLMRVTIDIVSGTSAGGINGIFLAKALANDLSIDRLLELWVEEGDISKLLNDAESVSDTALVAQTPPVALLNGRRMYAKLLEAFDSMDAEGRQARSGAAAPRYDASRVDLFVPTTDIRGESIHLPVTNTLARERRHRQRFQFTAEGAATPGRRNEFEEKDNAVLAYAARCTSSFPFAFEPFTWSDAAAIAGPRADKAAWRERLMYVGAEYERRPMGDGGFLDNKPFSYAVDQLARRQSDLDIRRALVYVEPDPEGMSEARDQLRSVKPDAIETAMAALIGIPGYETIREDLERVVKRNERVAQLERLERVVEKAVERPPDKAVPPLPERMVQEERDNLIVDDLIYRYGVGFVAYHRVRVDALIDALADLICSATGIGRPELVQVVRELVTLWVGAEYESIGKEFELLVDADIDFRLRKNAFVLRKLAKSTDPAVGVAKTALRKVYNDLYLVKRQMRYDVGGHVRALRGVESVSPVNQPGAAEPPLSDRRLEFVAQLRGSARSNAMNDLLRATLVDLEARPDADLKAYISNEVGPMVNDLEAIADAAVQKCAAAGSPDAEKLSALYNGFLSFDMVKFPIAQHEGVDEAVHVDLLRVSPRDMHVQINLAGVGLGHFAAFLEDDWRRNDIVGGRFNAAEVIINHLVENREEAQTLIREAHSRIAAELLPELQRRIASSRTVKSGGGDLEPGAQRRVDHAIGAVVNAEQLPAFFASGTAYDSRVDRGKQLLNAGRAGVIVEQILRGSALRARLPFPGILHWVAFFGITMAQIAIPRSFHRTVAIYWGRLLALVFLLIAVGGYLADSSALKRFGIRGLVVIAIVALLSLLAARWVGERLSRTLILLGRWAAVAAGLWFLAHAVGPRFGLQPPGPDARAVVGQILRAERIDIFFAGAVLGLVLGSSLLVVVEKSRSLIRSLGRRLRRSGQRDVGAGGSSV